MRNGGKGVVQSGLPWPCIIAGVLIIASTAKTIARTERVIGGVVGSRFTKSARSWCWDALASQRHRRIDSRGAQRGNTAREDPDERHHRRDADECHRIVRLYAEEESLHQARQRERTDDAQAQAEDDEQSTL